jgi:hypothetical protein
MLLGGTPCRRGLTFCKVTVLAFYHLASDIMR